jgi:outer membrane receptor for ferric coprogen and ferric-rhodotorulic acid
MQLAAVGVPVEQMLPVPVPLLLVALAAAPALTQAHIAEQRELRVKATLVETLLVTIPAENFPSIQVRAAAAAESLPLVKRETPQAASVVTVVLV